MCNLCNYDTVSNNHIEMAGYPWACAARDRRHVSNPRHYSTATQIARDPLRTRLRATHMPVIVIVETCYARRAKPYRTDRLRHTGAR